MSHADWETPIAAKVHGAWKLHEALRNQPVDFFIMLSSIYGARGNHGQANYAAANTFLDAFVQYRQQLKLPASVIDLGALDDIGHIAERPKLKEEMTRLGAMFVNESDFLDSLELAIQSSYLHLCEAPSITSGFVNRAQFVVGGIPHPVDVRGLGLPAGGKNTTSESASNSEALRYSDDSNSIQKFVRDARKDPQSLNDDAEAKEAFLGGQIFEAVKSLLLFDLEDGEEEDETFDMAELAIDSLMAIELQNWWRQSMGTQVSILELTGGNTVVDLGKLARNKLLEELEVGG